MPGPRAVQHLQMPHPQDWQGGQMPRSCPGGGRRWNWLMHKRVQRPCKTCKHKNYCRSIRRKENSEIIHSRKLIGLFKAISIFLTLMEEVIPVVCSKNWAGKPRSWRVGEKKPSGHGSYEPHFHAISKQDSLPNRFLVGSVCLRNLTCLHVGQWCIKQRVMLSNWGMANFVSSVSITPVKRLTSVNSVYSVNNFCRVCNVNFDI